MKRNYFFFFGYGEILYIVWVFLEDSNNKILYI